MSLFTVKMMSGSLPPVTGSNGSNVVKGPPAPTAAYVNPPTHPLQVSLAEYLTDYSTNLHLSMLKELLCLGTHELLITTVFLYLQRPLRVSCASMQNDFSELFLRRVWMRIGRDDVQEIVRPKELQKLEAPEKTSMNVSRRDLALFLTAASLSEPFIFAPQQQQNRDPSGSSTIS
ncbi:hypothetical protein Tco_1152562 [Tanacetum coccineum]